MRLQCIALVFSASVHAHKHDAAVHRLRRKKPLFWHAAVRVYIFIPLILILPGIMGLEGVQIAQPLADLFSFLTCLPFLYLFMLGLNEKEKNAKVHNNGKNYINCN